jgi:thioredoxin 1
MQDLVKSDFEKLVSNNRIAVIDFWATWCGPCKNQLKILSEIEQANAGAVFAKVNIDDEFELTDLLGIKSVPTILIYKNGELMHRLTGLHQKEILQDKIWECDL